MKTYTSNATVYITWTFCSDGSTLRSTVIGGFQAEIHKSTVTIRSSRAQGEVVGEYKCYSRRNGMNVATKQIMRMLEAA